ncbi:unnamed protein product [Vitrella brassicaformis CCMP3155]|uniref:ABC1 atypical kinase-like domain-containing protein n=2 Tax=Vitrella brassicaformis TaxID=1169539 RepID=A0A0G4EPY5_VITBC|nr:unnamed protein product [Vitrella brassicaformis CCMP3155]|mmetsp:Transcript_22870/g.65410  ORF Transcript_22870/g.65410 Transcript_22870/m.65410 type:complete len:698 (+) Transcript_22870:118-2211(+)|eukprot:CEL99479.1 unnamed protein product [Vitrella brassicaformis CCMP3155]
MSGALTQDLVRVLQGLRRVAGVVVESPALTAPQWRRFDPSRLNGDAQLKADESAHESAGSEEAAFTAAGYVQMAESFNPSLARQLRRREPPAHAISYVQHHEEEHYGAASDERWVDDGGPAVRVEEYHDHGVEFEPIPSAAADHHLSDEPASGVRTDSADNNGHEVPEAAAYSSFSVPLQASRRADLSAVSSTPAAAASSRPPSSSDVSSHHHDVDAFVNEGGSSTSASSSAVAAGHPRVYESSPAPAGFEPREIAVPSHPMSRVMHFGGLFMGLAAGTLAESVRRVSRGEDTGDLRSRVLSPQNAERISLTLAKMRGAALKLGQMLSLQEEYLPPILRDAVQRARNSADIMPKKQLHGVMEKELGRHWRSKFARFNEIPIAAASIGQVHEAWLHDGTRVAVKVQYPGVDRSIESDLKNLLSLVTYTNLVPKSMYLDVLAREMKTELLAECNYENEAGFYSIFRKLFSGRGGLYVPEVIHELSTRHVLTTEFVTGISLDEVVTTMDQATRDSIAKRLLHLCLHELFIYKIMQTDPNPANFFYRVEDDTLCLIDFGAGRAYHPKFVDDYIHVVHAAARNDYNRVVHYSKELGFLNGSESRIMLDAHVRSVVAVGEPFSAEGMFDFASTNIVNKVYELSPVMLEHRQKPPPPEVYSLHRKLAGCYLLCIKLKAHVPAKEMFDDVYARYEFSGPDTYQGV